MTIESTDVEDAYEFLDAIRPSARHWHQHNSIDSQRWLFRGQADADWPILPKLWRAGWGKDRYARLFENANATAERFLNLHESIRSDCERRRRAVESFVLLIVEREAVRSFWQLANELGLAVGDLDEMSEYQLRHQCGGSSFREETCHPKPIAALAQHHGVPTRLVDWTSNSLTAAYFAADDVFTHHVEDADPAGKRIVVWAIDSSRIGENRRLKLIPLPAHRSDFVRAQRGAFLFDRESEDEYVRSGERQCLGHVMNEQATAFPADSSSAVRKFTLPWTSVPALRTLLLVEGISKAHLMPTLDNVAQVSRERIECPPGSILVEKLR